MIEKPAQLAGIDVDDGLVDRLVDDTDSGEALPLLAFTLAQLADGVTRGGRLSSTPYDQLGRVQGALAGQADAALADAVATGSRSSEQVIAGLLRLVTIDEQGRPTRWRVNRDELSEPVATELGSFVARRLLTTDIDNDTVVIGVAHEAFLSAWPPLAEAIAANVAALRARRAVEHAATEWHDLIANHLAPELRQRLITALQDKANADYLRANGFCQGECAIADGFTYGYQPADDADYNGVREICRITQGESCTEG